MTVPPKADFGVRGTYGSKEGFYRAAKNVIIYPMMRNSKDKHLIEIG